MVRLQIQKSVFFVKKSQIEMCTTATKFYAVGLKFSQIQIDQKSSSYARLLSFPVLPTK